ncbi:MAG: cytochrome C [Chloroflexi bacterium]|nr:cytochrome C [Chloroflexota bacterium]MCL5275083.1 cytochrome C [Chloroflexota bacterium]
MKSLLSNLDSDVKVLLPDGSAHRLIDYLLPSTLLMLAALLLMISVFLPYWRFRLYAPQYPAGLAVNVYVNHFEGDMREIDELNHYLGMPVLDAGGRLERSISVISIVVLGLLLIAGVFVHNRWAALLALPAIAFPLIFIADLYLILNEYGHSIDPASALGGAIKPFTPPLMGLGTIGQFSSFSSFQPGFFLALAAVGVVLVSLWFHRAAYKPLADARKGMRAAGAGGRIVPPVQGKAG